MSGLPETIGRYQVVGSLGRGGMATVFKAFHPALDRTVAIKVIRRDLTDEPDFLDRFRQEAKAVARLRHPNIVQVFDFDEVDGKQFIVMEYLEGGTLKERLHALAGAGQRLPPREITRILGEVAEGLSYAHGFGILHRDVKPANILLTRDGRAVLTDFGIAKLLSGGSQLTRTGIGVGTPEYMAPEQARGSDVDARADVYSLAVIAYEMVTGRVPYAGDSAISVILQQINDPPPPPSEVDPRIGEATEAVLLKALAKDRDQRYAGATELGLALSEAMAADERDRTSVGVRVPGTSVPPPAAVSTAARVRRRWLLPAIAVIALSAATGVGVRIASSLDRSSTSPPPKAALVQPTGPGPTVAGARFDGQLVGNGYLTTQTPTSSGRVTSDIAPGTRFTIVLNVLDPPLRVDQIRSIGPITVEHPAQSFSDRPGSNGSCCYVAPAQPGAYRLVIGVEGGKIVAEIPYTVR